MFGVHMGILTEDWLLLNYYLFRTWYVRYFVVILCMCVMRFLTSREGVLSFSRALSDFWCTAPHTLVGTVIRGLTFHPF